MQQQGELEGTEILDPIESPAVAATAADGDGAIDRLGAELSELAEEISGDLVAITRDLNELVELRRGLDFDFERLEASLGLRGEATPAKPEAGTIACEGGEDRIALTMALNGAMREETARYLANNFDLSDEMRDRLLDYAYDSVDALRAGPAPPSSP